MTNKKQSGFTAFELMGAILVLSFVILTTREIVDNMSQTREYNQLADQYNQYSRLATKYITDNYRSLTLATTQRAQVIPFANISNYQPTTNTLLTKYKQSPCLYIINSTLKEQFQAYLLFGNVVAPSATLQSTSSNIRLTPHSQPMTLSATNAIIRNMGTSAGVLTLTNPSTSTSTSTTPTTNNNYIIKGGIENSFALTLTPTQMNNIITQCGYTTTSPNSVVIDLTKNKNLFASIKGNIDQQSSSTSLDPSLQKSAITTMQTSLYLDNVIKEASTRTNYYCDVAKLPPQSNNICQNTANTQGMLMYPNTASWTGSTQSGTSCIATSSARFYRISTSYSCSGVNMGNPSNYCPSALGNKTLAPNSVYWNPTPPELNGTQCIANAYAYYISPGICDGPTWWMDINNPDSRGDNDTPPNWQRAISNGRLGHGLMGRIACAIKQPDDWRSMRHCPGTYNPSTRMCDVRFLIIGYSLLVGSGNEELVTKSFSFAPTGGGQQDTSPTYCGQNRVSANPIQSTIDLGTLSCGPSTYPALTSTTFIPAQHVYRALDYGNNSISNGISGSVSNSAPISNQRIQIKTQAPSGATSYTNKLLVNNAGLQSGLIGLIGLPTQSPITPGSICTPPDLGKSAQETTNPTTISQIISSQLQCSYNPTFCSGTGFCYLPAKTTSFEYEYINPKSSSTCPIGTIVDNTQPTDNISTQATCPNSAPIRTETTNCYTGITGANFCTGYRTICSTTLQPIAALVKLKCTNTTDGYTINNYIPE